MTAIGSANSGIAAALPRAFPRENALIAQQAAERGADDTARRLRSRKADEFKDRFGEVIGGVFLAPVLQEAQKSPFKTKFSHGGHAEDVFQGQMALELSKKLGRAAVHGFGKELLAAAKRRVELK